VTDDRDLGFRIAHQDPKRDASPLGRRPA
jgi:hypothetical protein